MSEFQLKIPKFIGGQNKLNPIFDIIKSNYQIVVTRIDEVKETYILKEQIEYNEINKGNKTFTAYSLQKKLEDIHMKISERNYQLYENYAGDATPETSNDYVTKGILNEVEKQSGWKIWNVDESARREMMTVQETKVSRLYNPVIPSYSGYSGGKFEVTTMTFDYNYMNTLTDGQIVTSNLKSGDEVFYETGGFSTINNSIGEEPLYISIFYTLVYTFDKAKVERIPSLYVGQHDDISWYSVGLDIGIDTGKIQYGDIIHEFEEPFHSKIVSINTFYYNEIGNRNSLKYIFKMEDGTTKTIIKPFVRLDNRFLNVNARTINHNTGRYIKESTLLKPWFETTDDTVAKILSDISEVFNVAFEFDTMNKTINVHSLNSLGTTSDEASSRLGQFILGTSKLGTNPYSVTDSANLMLSYNDIISVNKTDNDSDIISGLKVTGKDNLSIVNINPNGTDTIENWDYFINNGNLTDSCISSLTLYNSTLKTRQANWNTMSQSYLDMNSTLITYESKIKSYQEQIIGLQSILSAYKKVNDTVNIARIQGELTTAQGILDSTINSKTILEDDLKELSNTMETYSEGSRKENIVDSNGNKIFSWSDLQILNDLTNIQTVNDDYFSDELALYEHYSQSMAEKVKPKVQFTTKTGNMSKYVYLNSNIIKLGLWYELDEELQKVFNEKRIRLISFEYYPNKGNIGSFENLTYSNKVTSINKFRKSATTTSKVEKTSQTVSKISSNTNKISNNLTDKVGTDSLINYNTNISGELDTKLSSVDFDNRFNNRESIFDFTIGSDSTKVKIDKNQISINNGYIYFTDYTGQTKVSITDNRVNINKSSFEFINSDGNTIVHSAYNMPKIWNKGISSITLDVGEIKKTLYIPFSSSGFYNVIDFSVLCMDTNIPLEGDIQARLPYFRINKDYNMDEFVGFNLFGQAQLGTGSSSGCIIVEFTRPENYKNTKETFELEWIVYMDME